MKRLIFTFAFILCLLGGFLAIWWVQSYNKDLASLRDQVEGEINRMVTEDFVFGTLQAILVEDGLWKYKEVPGSSSHRFPSASRLRVERIEASGEGAAEAASVTVRVDGGERVTSHFFFEDRKITVEELPATVRDSIQRKFGINLQQVFFPAGDQPESPLLVTIDQVKGGRTFSGTTFIITQHLPGLLLGLLPEFLFGLVLFGATGFAFSSAYRNLYEQDQQLRQKDALVANVAHELKTPIATVGVALEALNVFGADADPVRRQEYLAIGQAELKRLDHMADRAIDSLQDGALSQRLQWQHTDLAAAVSEAWRGLALRYQLAPEALQLTTYGDTHTSADPHYWYHLVYNLLDNACKYGGRPLRIEVNVAGHAHETVLTVADNGCGIPTEERENIFERFYRIYRPGEGHTVKGHGLGLSFVRQVVLAHGGTVEVDNGRDGGARFTVKIPARTSLA
ncbi:HAMP domain-containing sensor histidine kinase [Neolewinella lacunae]|uniref:histidine kinase n=1 Tax=Neolewinella lacunae TaxID=1517758 RepID=A0A923PLQ8_9BACT|nr:HAMP domain-containing sensor histidine kinase [Neolewinella lacunae]MBC6996488.1 HAMP domain-containing histidine kinase [Neolewinella lacunae]MDN3636641.1 HAMP domain-containing sensor histidine kinase [Neolewinella lacunae]